MHMFVCWLRGNSDVIKIRPFIRVVHNEIHPTASFLQLLNAMVDCISVKCVGIKGISMNQRCQYFT